MPRPNLELRSLITPEGALELSLAELPMPEPGPGEVVVEMGASPINPSDLGLLLGPADPSSAQADGGVTRFSIAPQMMRFVKTRTGQSMPVGNEGAGTVVAAGEGAEGLKGKVVAVLGGAMYVRYRKVRLADILELPEGSTAEQGASCFVNPLTALGMVDTMRNEGHQALVHTAAASNLGQMLNRICVKDGVELTSIVRSPDQKALLEKDGAKRVVDSSAPGFLDELTRNIAETKATIGFDAIGGGRLAGQILSAMEVAASAAEPYSRYGSSVFKQVYIYGALDTGPTELTRSFGLSWSVSGWLLTPFLQKVGGRRVAELKARVAAELTTTFASHYSRTISLEEALKPEIIAAYAKRSTGEKYLIDPSR